MKKLAVALAAIVTLWLPVGDTTAGQVHSHSSQRNIDWD